MADDTPEPVLHARAAAEAIRQINHLTIHGDGELDDPHRLADVLSALAQAAERLPQALHQLARVAGRLGERDDLYDDRNSWRDAATTCGLVKLNLQSAAVVGTLADDLRNAAADLNHLRAVRNA